MIFVTFRTSGVFGKKQPCAEAFPMGKRRLPDGSKQPKWGIEVTSIQEMVLLSGKYGELIISPPGQGYLEDPEPTLEIYDSRRER